MYNLIKSHRLMNTNKSYIVNYLKHNLHIKFKDQNKDINKSFPGWDFNNKYIKP